ncbi:hypothetical protein BURCENBC7_AP0436 [Burkholderia cenocepacia BC7]|nr:uncharacterized protein BCN122_II1647 [Burkholderia cenocepacia]EPZ89043.1 hypothetical protein BURCENK562V_C3685 [Burkholderia cenocepacia K56-2Valvano]ERI29073.1 hypothetical protein BURCENBC7_AP0436 [Burkholderia cenocepacia BC7]
MPRYRRALRRPSPVRMKPALRRSSAARMRTRLSSEQTM